MKLLGENEFAQFYENDGIVIIKYINNVKLDLIKIQLITEFGIGLTKHIGKHFIIVDANDFASMSFDAKNYIIKYVMSGRFYAIAIISNNNVTNFWFNVFVKSWPSLVPIKKFQSYENAKGWFNLLDV